MVPIREKLLDSLLGRLDVASIDNIDERNHSADHIQQAGDDAAMQVSANKVSNEAVLHVDRQLRLTPFKTDYLDSEGFVKRH